MSQYKYSVETVPYSFNIVYTGNLSDLHYLFLFSLTYSVIPSQPSNIKFFKRYAGQLMYVYVHRLWSEVFSCRTEKSFVWLLNVHFGYVAALQKT